MYELEPSVEADILEQKLKQALAFAGSLNRAYSEATSPLRRQMNQALFSRIFVSDDGEVVGELRPAVRAPLPRDGDYGRRPRPPRSGSRNAARPQEEAPRFE